MKCGPSRLADLPENMRSNPDLYADDVSLSSVIKCQLPGRALLNDDLLEVSKWSYQWKMIFNPDINKQAVEMYFSNRSKQTNISPYYSMAM